MRALRMAQVCALTGLCETTIRKLIKAGEFPCPFKLGPRAIAFVEQEVLDWLAARAAARQRVTYAAAKMKEDET
jgi:prophage regulatory protein